MFRVAGPLWAQATAGGDNIFVRFVKTGKKVLRRVLQRKELEHTGQEIPKPTWSLRAQSVQVGQSSKRRLIGGLFPEQALKTPAAEIRRQAALRLIRESRKVPVFAFVGLSLGFSANAQKPATNDDLLCSGIRELFEKYGPKKSTVIDEAGQQFSLESLQLGQLIGKGCNAAVYEARPVNFSDVEAVPEVSHSTDSQQASEVDQAETADPVNADSCVDGPDEGAPPAIFHTDDHIQTECQENEEEDEFTIISEDELGSDEDPSSSSDVVDDVNMDGWVLYKVSSGGTSVSASPSADTEDVSDSDSDIFILAGDADELESVPDLENMELGWSVVNTRPPGMMSHSNVMTESTDCSSTSRSLSSGTSSETSLGSDSGDNSVTMPDPEPAPNIHGSGDGDYGLAVKMMYNYSVVSRADEILTAMAKETVPAQCCVEQTAVHTDNEGLQDRLKKLPSHPNIVAMHGVFVDQTPELPEGAETYPSALPPRLNKDGGFGRNATMFLVMKKYDMTLREYLSLHDPDLGTRCRLFAQLLEGVAHLSNQEIAHRDLKSDNILLDLSHGNDHPSLAITDFGCCLADPTYGLKLPYLVREVDKGGNGALMAPEIKCAQPGKNSVLDYSKADLWAAGALAYEIFSCGNPFYHQLDARTYSQDDLPSFSADVPEAVVKLVDRILSRDPAQRPSPTAAATAMQVFLWAPTHLQPFVTKRLEGSSNPLWRCKELSYWLEQLTMETVCQRVYGGGASQMDVEMKTVFLSRIRQEDIFGVVALD